MTLGEHRLHRTHVERVSEHIGVVDVAVVAVVPVGDPVTADVQITRVVDDGAGGDRTLVDRARERDDLHHRAGLVEVARDVVLEERRVGVCEVVGVVARVVGPGDDSARGGIHDQHAAALGVCFVDAVRKCLLGCVLHVGVQRQNQV